MGSAQVVQEAVQSDQANGDRFAGFQCDGVDVSHREGVRDSVQSQSEIARARAGRGSRLVDEDEFVVSL